MSWTKWSGKAVEQTFTKACSDAVLKAAEATGAISDQQVPHDEGFLQSSKYIGRDPNNSLVVHIGYGGGGVTGFPIVPYAIKWHENPANFQKGRKHNYLRDPMKINYPKYLKQTLNQIGLK